MRLELASRVHRPGPRDRPADTRGGRALLVPVQHFAHELARVQAAGAGVLPPGRGHRLHPGACVVCKPHWIEARVAAAQGAPVPVSRVRRPVARGSAGLDRWPLARGTPSSSACAPPGRARGGVHGRPGARFARRSLRSALASLGARFARRSLRSALASLGARFARRSLRSASPGRASLESSPQLELLAAHTSVPLGRARTLYTTGRFPRAPELAPGCARCARRCLRG